MSNNLLLQSVHGNFLQTLEQFAGSDCSGSDGDADRVLTASTVTSALGEIMVVKDHQVLRKTDEFTVTGNAITIIGKTWDEAKLEVIYFK